MSNFSRIISFGASITFGSELPSPACTWSSIIAQKLQADYLCLAKPAASNANIARQIISYADYYKQSDVVLVMWTSATRYEFRTEDSWQDVSPWSEQTGFVRDWYRGPGNYEYTEVVTTLKEIALATQFLESMGLKYLFVFDNDELRNSHTWSLPDDYIQTLKLMLPWNNIMWFDDIGFLDWSKKNGYPFTNTHPGVEAHQSAADYILANRCFSSVSTAKLPALL